MSETLELEKITNEFPEKIDGIKKALENLIVTESKVAEFKEKYEGLTIVDRNDKDGYKAAREAKSVLVKTRTSSEDDRKLTLKPIDELRDNVHNRFKSVQDDLKKIEEPISKQIKEIDDIEEQEKEQKKLEAEKKINDRINCLLENGMVFQDGYYIIKNDELQILETSIGVVDIRTMSDDLFKNLLQIVIDKNAKIVSEKERVEKERIAAEELKAENDRKERELFEQQKEQMRLQQEEMDRQKEQIETQRKANQQLITIARQNLLEALGFSFYGTVYEISYKGLSYKLLHEQVENLTNEAWLLNIGEAEKVISQINSQKNIDAEESKKQAEIDKRENEKRIAQQAIEDENKRKQEEKEKAELELAQADDKTKYESILAQIKALQVPDFKSNIYKNKAKIIKDFIADLK